jgi:hypothetical protein
MIDYLILGSASCLFVAANHLLWTMARINEFFLMPASIIALFLTVIAAVVLTYPSSDRGGFNPGIKAIAGVFWFLGFMGGFSAWFN